MRAFPVMMFVLCAVGGLYLLVVAPEFSMPSRDNPTLVLQFGPEAARALGAALLAVAALARIFLHHHFAETRRTPSPMTQKIYFALIVLALGLISLSFNLAEPVPAPPAQSAPPAP